MKHGDFLRSVYILISHDSLRHRIKQAQRQNDWINAICKVLETGIYCSFCLKYYVLSKDPIKELIVIPSRMKIKINTTANW